MTGLPAETDLLADSPGGADGHGGAFLRALVAELDALADDPAADPARRRAGLEARRAALADSGSDLSRDLAHHGIPPQQADQLAQARLHRADGLRIATWGELLAHAGYAAGPVGRILLSWDGNGDPAAARAADALCAALFVLGRVAAAKADYTGFDRVFLPLSYFREAAVGVERLAGATAQGQIRAVLDRALDGADRLLAEAAPLPRLLRGRARRRAARRTLCAARCLARRVRAGDPFAGPITLTRWDRLRCAVAAVLP